MLLSFAAWLALQPGFTILSLKVAREQPAKLSDLFSGWEYLGLVALNSVIFWVMVAIGWMACFIPGLLLQAMFFPYVYAIVDENRHGIDGLYRAKELTTGNLGSTILIVLMSLAAIYVSSMCCNLAAIVTVPFTSVMMALAYERMTYQTPINPSP
jgi:uncharacterized membrane protein